MNIEQALIGSLLVYNDKWVEVRDIIDKDDFENKDCKFIFHEIEQYDGKCNLSIMSEIARKWNRKELIKFLNDAVVMADNFTVIQNANYVKEESRRRQTKIIAENMNKLASDGRPIDEVISTIDNQLISLAGTKKGGFRTAKEIAFDYLERLMMLSEKGTDISGLPSGFRKLDLITDGFKQGELTIIGARPSQGKTSLMLSFADYISVELKKNVAIFSIESPENEIFNKFISGRAMISNVKLRRGKLLNDEHGMMMNAVDKLGCDNLFINCIPIISVMSIRAHIKKLCNLGNKPDIVFIDYLQIIEVEKGLDTFANKIARVTQGLKNIAKELDVPVVVLAQINRANGEDHPRLIDLKDSGAIEAIADMVILLHREEFYKKDKCPDSKKGIIDIDIAKNRNGAIALIELGFKSEFTKFIDLESYQN